MNILQLINSGKRLTRTPKMDETDPTTEVDDAITFDDWMEHLNASQNYFHGKLIQAYEDFFINEDTVSYSAGTNEYSIPGQAVQIRMVERQGTTYNTNLHPISFDLDNAYTSPSNAPTETYPQFFYLKGRKIGIVDADVAGTANVIYVRRLPDLVYGTVASPSATSFALPSSPTLGKTSIVDDYYNGASFYIYSATAGSGQSVVCTDYVGATRVLTYSAPTVTPTGTVIAGTECEIPSQWHIAVATYAALLAKIGDDQAVSPDLKQLVGDMIESAIASIIPRQSSESRHVFPTYRD